MASFLDALNPFGSKPQVIPWTDVLLSDAQAQALTTNIKDWSSIEGLGNLWQNYILAGLEKAVPGFGGLLSGMTGTTQTEFSQAQQELEGKIPADVLAQTARTGAFKALGSTGATGSPLELSEMADQFGLTSLNMINQGANLAGNAAQRWQQLLGFGQSTLAPIQNMLITPQEQYSANLTNEVNRQRTEQEAANVAAAPNPVTKGISDLVAYLTASYVSSLGGKPGGAGQPPAAPGYGQYFAGDVSTPSGAGYGTGANPAYSGDVTNQGYPVGGSSNVAAAPGGINDTTLLPTGGATTASTDPLANILLNPSIGYQLPDNSPYASLGGSAGMSNLYAGAYPPWLAGQGLASGNPFQTTGYPADFAENY